jgi:hypothetical protein
MKHNDVHISILWRYFPGEPASFSGPEIDDELEFLDVNIPDELEGRAQQIKWQVQDSLGVLIEQALEQIAQKLQLEGP